MALIGKIRNNSWVLIVMVAVGMGGFILQDVVTNQGQRQSANFEMANVNGKSIDYREFQNTESVLYSGASQDPYAQKASLWNYFRDKAIVESETEDLGIGVSYEELLDLQFGQNLSPIITARFSTQTGQIDRERLNSFRTAIEANDLDPRFKQYWAVQEEEIIKDRKQKKLQNLAVKAVYTPQWLAEEYSKEAGSKAEFEYVKIPFDKIADEEVELSDDAVKEFMSNNKVNFTNDDETRVLSYLEFQVLPTAADSIKNKNESEELISEFKSATNDSLFVLNNSGNYSYVYYKPEDLPEAIQEAVVNMEVGDVHGPYLDTDKYTLAKLVAKKLVADSVKARHILKSINPQDQNSFIVAQQTIDSLKTLLEEGSASFDSLAINNSDDPGSATKGGDLGYFAQGAMVPTFNYACFLGDENVKYHVVNSQFGVHMIEVVDRKYLDNEAKLKVAYISNSIVPSQETQDSIYDIATELVTNSNNAEELTTQVADIEELEIKESTPLRESDYRFETFGSDAASRELIRWAYEPGVEVGDISSVIYTYTDKEKYFNSKYVVISLSKINSEGLMSVQDAIASSEIRIKNYLKGNKLADQIQGGDLNSIATQFEVGVDTVNTVPFNSAFIPDLGNEPAVLYHVFNGNINEVSGPIVGNTGVFVVKPLLINKSDQASSDYLQQKSSTETKVRNEANFRFMESLRKNAEIEDNRYLYF